ncbi:MAG TPA: phenylalanine--tRNA ligase beta subunit-related protein, partial [Thermoanaerobaculia bacterium]|nr:phenylalanine--tRNA ligase beta subunit-related protein [Thermoanaerobaculia bacterium]
LRGSINSVQSDLRETVADLRAKALASLTALAPTPEALAEVKNVSVWREAYKAFGAKPTKFRPTHEALARRLLKDGVWPDINPVVDIYLTNQIDHLLPHGGYDATALAGDLKLYVSPGNEPFEPLGGGQEATEPGEVVYRDQQRVLTRRWNYRDCDATKITEQTTDFVLMIEAPGEIEASEVEKACSDLAQRYARAFEGRFRPLVFEASKDSREVEIP